jgi:hypothetical protein
MPSITSARVSAKARRAWLGMPGVLEGAAAGAGRPVWSVPAWSGQGPGPVVVCQADLDQGPQVQRGAPVVQPGVVAGGPDVASFDREAGVIKCDQETPRNTVNSHSTCDYIAQNTKGLYPYEPSMPVRDEEAAGSNPATPTRSCR